MVGQFCEPRQNIDPCGITVSKIDGVQGFRVRIRERDWQGAWFDRHGHKHVSLLPDGRFVAYLTRLHRSRRPEHYDCFGRSDLMLDLAIKGDAA
jgi:hypothetical protein